MAPVGAEPIAEHSEFDIVVKNLAPLTPLGMRPGLFMTNRGIVHG